MRKKGVSPLIASVLLIAFTIMLFVLITTWVRKSVEPGMSQAEEKLGSALECMNTKIEIISACVSGSGANTEIKVKVDNNADNDNIMLYGMKVRAIGSTNIGTGDIDKSASPVAPWNRLEGSAKVGDVGTISKIEVYPETKSGVCRDAVETKTGIAACSP